jgi:uncharacterized membrane protein
MKLRNPFGHWRANFLAGLAIVLPAVITLAVVRWLVGTVSNVTDVLLIFLPTSLTHERAGEGPMLWYWSLLALALAVLLISLIGRSARHYAGKKLIEWVDIALLRIPLLNKIYGAVKQVNEAFTTNSKTAFKQVVMIEYPRAGAYSIGFVTTESPPEGTGVSKSLIGVFIPTTPNPTSGFLVLVKPEEVIRLSMSVPDGIKYIISLGAITKEPGALTPGFAPTLNRPPLG